MPIVSNTWITTVPGLTTATVCRPTAQSIVLTTPGPANFVKRELLWSHSEVFVTHFGTLSTLEYPNVPDLTTVHTPASSCLDRWMVRPSESCGDGSSISNIVWSINPTHSIVSDLSYSGCQLYGKPTYSPGICPSGQTIAEVTAFESSVSNGNRTFWQASCYRRYDTTSASATGSELTYNE
jgi:hypothetical protein